MSGVRIGRLGGVELTADGSVLVLAAVLAWALFVDLRLTYPDADGGDSALVAALAAVILVACILLHELSHAWVAQRRGLTVRRIRLFIFGGYSIIESQGLDPGDELAVAAAGPLASALLAAAFWVTGQLIAEDVVVRAVNALALFNAAIAGFNLLPGFPLDGGRVLRAGLWRKSGDRVGATRRAAGLGSMLGLGVVGVGAFILFRFGDLSGGVWVVVGWFLHRSAVSAGRREELLARIGGLVVGDVMREVTDAVPASMTVARMIELYQFGPRLRSMPIEVDGRVQGILGEREIEGLSPGRRAAARAVSVMTRITRDDVVGATMPLDVFFAKPAGRSGRAIVVDGRHVVGVVESVEVAHLFERAVGLGP
jgi:Zn-dependent protease